MPINTPHFGLQAFVAGDAYSARVDQRRMKIIDQSLAFVADLIGPGIIAGWDISSPSPLTIRASSGWGIIDRLVTRTFGHIDKSIEDNSSSYIWIRQRPGVLSQVSVFAGPSVLSYSNTNIPSIPVGLFVSSKTTTTILISWMVNTEVDFSNYQLFRSTDNITFMLIASLSQPSYLDLNLQEDTIYYYKIQSVTFSGISSGFSSVLPVKTNKDLTPPGDPTNLFVTNSDGSVHLLWRPSGYGNISTYLAIITPVTSENIVSGSFFTVSVPVSINYMTITGLQNNQRYRIVLYTQNSNGVNSSGITVFGFPSKYPGPRDVVDITISDQPNTGPLSNVVMSVGWIPFTDEYISKDLAVSFQIQITEIGDGQNFISEVITVIDNFSYDFQVYPLKNVSGQIDYRSILPRTEYFIEVKSVDANGVVSQGLFAYHKTHSFIAPSSPLLAVANQRSDQSIVVSWQNSVQFFNHNEITIKDTDLSNNFVVLIENQSNLKNATSYFLASDKVKAGHEYEFDIFAIDEFGNQSLPAVVTLTIPDVNLLPRPPVPSGQIIFSGSGEIDISWTKPNINYIAGYRIYRSAQKVKYTAADFQILETINSPSVFSYVDYAVDVGAVYAYFVTTLDIYGRESLNPVQDMFFDYVLLFGSPSNNEILSAPTGLLISASGFNANLSWQPTGGQFDGYEIYKSFNNRYSWIKIGITDPGVTNFTDVNGLIKSGTYNYIVRKFGNEADVFITKSIADVQNAVFVGKAISLNGSISFDFSNRIDLQKLQGVLERYTNGLLSQHHHSFNSANDDRRINLSDSTIVANWQTSDFQTYTTTTDISPTTLHKVFLNNQESNILSTIDTVNGILFFERHLASGSFNPNTLQPFPFSSPPVVTVEFFDLSEVQNKLPSQRIENISAQQISNGLIENNQLPSFNHEGRLNEILFPVQISTFTIDDGYRFAPVNASDLLGDGLTWYDVISVGDDNLLASTSDGIYLSQDFGSHWSRVFQTTTPVIDFLFDNDSGFYFALTNRGILNSGGNPSNLNGFSVWAEVKGIEAAKISRKFAIDNGGNVLISSDLGVYRLQKVTGDGSLSFVQTPIFGPRSTESYGILYDSVRQRIIVSNELGIFETSNGGNRWDFSTEMPEQRIIYDFFQSESSIFAATKTNIWRLNQHDVNFIQITNLDVKSVTRVIVWRNRLFISTDKGLLISDVHSDIYTDTSIEFSLAYPAMNRLIYVAPATSLDIISDYLFIGTEQRLHISKEPGNISLLSDISGGTIPTIYIDGIEQKIGFRYSTSTDRGSKFVCFDEKQRIGASITVANQYQNYYTPSGGWADANFGSTIALKINGQIANDGSIADKPIDAINNVVLPKYTDRNANQVTADEAFDSVQSAFGLLMETNTINNQTIFITFTRDNVRNYLASIERFLSQIYPSARVVPETDNQGNPIFRDSTGKIISSTVAGSTQNIVSFKMPSFDVVCLAAKTNYFQLGITSFGKYNSIYGSQTAPGSFGSVLSTNQPPSGGSGG